MLRNYFKTALRNISGNRLFAILNIFGLALGMSISLIFIAMLSFLMRYDEFHPLRERTYRIITHIQDNDENPSFASTPVGLAQILQEEISGIDRVIRINGSLGGTAVYNEKQIPLNGYFADPNFLESFNFPLTSGDRTSALAKPSTVVITEELGKKIFEGKDPLGELINLAPFGEVMITGVLKDLPPNSHMQFEAIASYATLLSYMDPGFVEAKERWIDFRDSYVYILLPENGNAASIERSLETVAKEKYAQQDVNASFKLQRIDDIVPGPDLRNAIGPSWDYVSLTLVGLITIIIIVPACANYINLTISQSLKRMKEIGIRKVMGGQKKQIFFQFIMETTITMLIALVISYIFFEAIREEALETIADPSIMNFNPTLLTFVGFILFALLVGLIAGVVPALYFAKISPVKALKSKELKSGLRGGFTVRKVVITVQFIMSLGFIMAVVIVMQQYRFSMNYDFGFDREDILDVEIQNSNPALLTNEFGKLSSVRSMSMASHIIGLQTANGYVKNVGGQDSLEIFSMSVDENFIPNMNLELLQGRNFSGNPIEDSRLVIINEEFAKRINAPDVVNQLLTLTNGREVRIAGVVKNFHYGSLRNPIGSFYFENDPAQFKYANIRLQPGDRVEQVAGIEAAWKTIGGEERFTARMLSDEIGEAYEFYFIVMKLWSFLGLLAVTVACIGLLGTVVSTIKNRLKEISIRKVMGATSESLVVLLSKDFVILMIIASVITIPVMYFLFEKMLVSVQHYRIDIGIVEILISVSIMLLLGMTTILSQTTRAANANPVDNLKAE